MSYLKSVFTLTFFSLLTFTLYGQLGDVSEGCATLEVKFTAPSGSTYFWDFGNGATSTQRNPTHNYEEGTWIAKFSNSEGGTVIDEQEIKVYAKPIIDFGGNPSSGCIPLSTLFTDNSTIDPDILGNITAFNWTFGDGNSGSGNPVSHTYNTIGSYSVSLEIVSDLPNCTVSNRIEDLIVTSTLAAGFTANNLSACTAPLTVTFTNTTDDPNSNLTYAWDFGNGNTSSDRTPPVQTYTQEGAYPVTLTVTDTEGCSVVASDIVNIGSPLVGFNIADTICSGIAVLMDNTSSNGDYLWNFGAGANPMTSTDRNPVVEFFNEQNYNISLTVTDPDGCSNDTTITVYVDMVFANFVSDPVYSCNVPQEFTYTPTDTNIDSTIWTYNDASQSMDMIGSFTVEGDTTTYGRNGEQIIVTTLTAFNERGCKGFFERADTVHAPNALFTVDTTMGCAPLTVTFFDSLSTSNEAIVTYTYVWGDGTQNVFLTDIPAPHIYLLPGDYEPFLIIENAAGCKDTSYSIPIYVGRAVAADFTVSQSVICPGDSVFFMGTGDSEIDAWHFDAEGGRLSHCADDANPAWIFESMTGTMDVDLTVLYNGCPTTVSKSDFITVNGPIAQIDYMIDCDAPFNVVFEDQSMDATTRNWTFGDNTNSSIANQTVTYDDEGDYQVILEAINDMSGCPTSYDTVMVSIRDIKAEFELEDIYCIGEMFDLDATMSNGVNADCWKGYTWFPSDTRPITTQDESIEYAWSGRDTQYLELIVEDINGCKDTLRDTTLVIETIADFSFTPNPICTPNEVTFTDLSTSDTTIVMWTWDFGDGNVDSMNQNTNHTYGAGSQFSLPDGTFDVSLLIEDETGCTAQTMMTVEIYSPEIFLIVPDDTHCVGDIFDFSATDQTNQGSFLTYEWFFDGQPLGITGNSGSVEVTEAGEFELRVEFTEDATGCKQFRTKTIFVQAYPDATFTSPLDANDVNCAGQITFTAVDQNNPAVTAAGYTWNPGDNVRGNVFTPFTYSEFYDRGTYSPSLTLVTTFGCESTFTREYTFVAPDGDLLVENDSGTEVFSDIEICAGDELKFTVTNLVDVESFRIDFGDGTQIEDTSPITYSFPPLPDGQLDYRVRLTLEQDINGVPCTSEEVFVVNVKDFDLDIGADQEPCFGDTTTLTVTSDSMIEDWNIIWSTGDRNRTTIEFVPELADPVYYVRVTDPISGCDDTDTVRINVVPPVNIMGDYASRLVTTPDVDVTLISLNEDFNSDRFNINWDPSLDAVIAPVVTGGISDGQDSIVYTAIVTDTSGCYNETFIRVIRLLKIPNIFSPNGDSRNANFNIIGNYEVDDIASFKIFNRWGQVIYDNDNPTTGWDGKYKDSDQPVGVYVYIIEINDTDGSVKTLSGDVTLLR